LKKLAPPKLAQSWDNTGLLIGRRNVTVKKILLTIDITKEGCKRGQTGRLVIFYKLSPGYLDGLKTVLKDSPVFELVNSGISVYSIHTALDAVVGGAK